jgi:hypothetical protein
MKTLAFLASLICVAVVGAQPAVPTGPAPSFSYVRKTTPEKGLATLVRMQTIAEMVPVNEKRLINGKLIDVTTYQTRYKQIEVDIYYDLGVSRVITADGKQLPIDEVWKRLKPNTMVAISGNSSSPHEAYLRALNPDLLVIIPAEPKDAPKK